MNGANGVPIRGVPKTRADCPMQRPCPHLCRHNLLVEDAEHRAGRPGLSSVPRDARGWTLPVEGDAGEDRPGTTLRPAWLQVRGLELERELYNGELSDLRNALLPVTTGLGLSLLATLSGSVAVLVASSAPPDRMSLTGAVLSQQAISATVSKTSAVSLDFMGVSLLIIVIKI